jgi:hypothetical protein
VSASSFDSNSISFSQVVHSGDMTITPPSWNSQVCGNRGPQHRQQGREQPNTAVQQIACTYCSDSSGTIHARRSAHLGRELLRTVDEITVVGYLFAILVKASPASSPWLSSRHIIDIPMA